MSPLTPCQIKVMKFFKEHPQAVETVRGIATWLGDEQRLIEQALKDLVGRKWISADETTACTAYTLTRDDRILTQIRETLGGA